MEEPWDRAVTRLGALHDPRARATHPALQAGEVLPGEVRQQPSPLKDFLSYRQKKIRQKKGWMKVYWVC